MAPGGVSYTVRRFTLLFALVSTLRAADTLDTDCPAKGPVLKRVLETEELITQSSYCAPPTFAPLVHPARIQAVVTVGILVDREGRVTCVKAIKGHPLLLPVSLEAARKWIFRPMTRRGRAVSFYGNLTFTFEFSTNETGKLASCTTAHW